MSPFEVLIILFMILIFLSICIKGLCEDYKGKRATWD